MKMQVGKSLRGIVLSAMAFIAQTATATTYTWQGGTGTVDGWNVPGNWSSDGSGTGVPTGGDEAVFNGAVTISSAITIGEGVLTITANANVTLSGIISGVGGIVAKPAASKTLYFSNQASTFTGQFTIQGAANGTTKVEKLANGGVASSIGCGTAGVPVRHFSGKLYVNSTCTTDRPFHLEESYNNDLTVNGTLTLEGDITGTGIFTRTGTVVVMSDLPNTFTAVQRTNSGTLILGGSGSTFTATPNVEDGVLEFKSIANSGVPCSLGAGTTVKGGAQNTLFTFAYSGSTDASTDRTFDVRPRNGDATTGCYFYNKTAGTTLTLTGSMNFSRGWGTQFITVGGEGNIVFDTALPANMHGLTKTGSGTVTLAGDNLYSSNTVVSAGRLDVTGSTDAKSSVTVASGAVLGGTGAIHGPATITGTLSAGTATICGALAFDAETNPLTFASGSTLLSKVGGGSNDRIDVTGAVAASGSVIVKLVPLAGGSVPAGTYTVMTYDSPPSDVFVLDASLSGTIAVGANALTVTMRGAELTWSGNASANFWDFTTANWSGGLFTDGADVVFSDAGVKSVPVEVAVDVEPASVRVSADSGTYTFAGPGKITGDGSLGKTGAGNLVIANTNDYTGTTLLQAGSTTLSGVLSGTSVNVQGGAGFHETPSGVIAGSDIDVTFGHGDVLLEGTNTFTGRIAFDYSSASTATKLYLVHSNVLGNAESLTVKPSPVSNPNYTKIVLSNNVEFAGKTLYVARGGTSSRWLRGEIAHNFKWSGDIAVPEGDGAAPTVELSVSANKVCTIGKANETEISGLAGLSLRDMGTCNVNGRVNIPGTLGFNEYGYRYFYSTNNVCGKWTLFQGAVAMGANYVFAKDAVVEIGKAHSQAGHNVALNLNGTTQQVAQVVEVYTDPSSASGTRRISGAAPSTLIVKSDDLNSSFGSVTVRGTTRTGEIVDGVALVKDGAARFDLNVSTNSFSGDVTVLGGVLAANSPGSLGVGRGLPSNRSKGEGDKNLVVTGGTLELNAAQFALTNAVVAVGAKNGASGVVSLAEGVVQDVRYLKVGGELMRPGVYGGPESAAAEKLNCFAGTGLLRVAKGASGLMVVVF